MSYTSQSSLPGRETQTRFGQQNVEKRTFEGKKKSIRINIMQK